MDSLFSAEKNIIPPDRVPLTCLEFGAGEHTRIGYRAGGHLLFFVNNAEYRVF
jgi:hypothetical protein